MKPKPSHRLLAHDEIMKEGDEYTNPGFPKAWYKCVDSVGETMVSYWPFTHIRRQVRRSIN